MFCKLVFSGLILLTRIRKGLMFDGLSDVIENFLVLLVKSPLVSSDAKCISVCPHFSLCLGFQWLFDVRMFINCWWDDYWWILVADLVVSFGFEDWYWLPKDCCMLKPIGSFGRNQQKEKWRKTASAFVHAWNNCYKLQFDPPSSLLLHYGPVNWMISSI